MSIVNCELFKPTDINVRTSIFHVNPKYYVPAAYKAAFLELIRDSLGAHILLNEDNIFATITKINGSSKTFSCVGTTLMLFIKDCIRCVEPIRIDITSKGHDTRSWVFLIK